MNFKFFKSVASRMCLATLVALMATTMVSCDKNLTGDSVASEEPTMIGRWEGVSFDVDNNDNWIDITSNPHDEFAFTVEFREDGTFEGTGYLGNGDGTYVATSTTITVYKDGAVYAHYTIKELTYTDAYVVVVMSPAIFHFRLRRVFVCIEPWG
ncbi:MAG: hypothetical protein R3Y68_02095 [Rikenellaceae bacterium]